MSIPPSGLPPAGRLDICWTNNCRGAEDLCVMHGYSEDFDLTTCNDCDVENKLD